ncbi:Holliday junction resolvase [Candidatus Woesearchaeota archaeon]|nr:Holliday junction resolvase [Candidatus Woesearchaeota archaeon]
MNRKSKGINAERDLVHMFWDSGWAAVRTPASGAARFPCPDVIASNRVRKLAIECKTSRDKAKYFQEGDLDGLKGFATAFGAEPWVGVKFNNQKWFFVAPEDLQKTQKGFCITLNSAKVKGVLFEELLQED